MKISTKFILLLIPIHLAALILAFLLLNENRLWFLLVEAAVIASFVGCLLMLRAISQPLRLLLSGIDAIKDQDFNVKFVETGKYETDKLIGVYNEMIDRLREERTRQEQQHFFLDKLIHTSPTAIIILDFDGNITELNPKARAILGLSQDDRFIGRPLDSLEHPVAQAAASLASGETQAVHLQGLETYKCRKAHFVDRGFARPFIMVEELTSEILRAEKKAYGKVIRMMAHEVNNTIGAINSILEAGLSYGELMPEAEGEEFREVQRVCIERNDRLNRFMRNFADIVRLPEPHLEHYPLNRLLEDAARLMKGMAAQRGINLELQLPKTTVYAEIDLQQLEQVLVNALKNAMESIGEEGEIQLVLQEQPPQILIRDNGPGIPPELEGELFSPFFTTKKDGQGVGLTLSREILLNHGWSFSLKTLPDGWTEFRLVPRSSGEASA